MDIESITQETDGSAWIAVVRVRGVMYVASYVDNSLNVRIGPYRNAPKRPRWYAESVRRWAQQQIDALPAEWMAAHRALYA